MRLPKTFAGMLALGLWGACAVPAGAQDAVVRIAQSQFKAGAGRITFAEVPVGAENPTYPPSLYQGGAGSPTVRFGGFFRGQRLGTPAECPQGAVLTGCVVGGAAAPLMIDPASPGTSVQMNGTAQGGLSAGLAGSPRWNGPIAIWFDRDVAAVGLDGGFFDAPNSTAITVFDRQGRLRGGFHLLQADRVDLLKKLIREVLDEPADEPLPATPAADAPSAAPSTPVGADR